MSEIIELVFEEINIKSLDDIIMDISNAGSLIKKYSIKSDTEKREILSFKNPEEIQNIFDGKDGIALFINLTELNFDNIRIPNCMIRIISYDNKYDFEINFNNEDAILYDIETLKKVLTTFSVNLANRYKIKKYYCGYEPACDEENRLFTSNRY